MTATIIVIVTKVRICVLVFLRQILNQVQDDGQCHPDESQDLTLLTPGVK